MAIPIDKVLHLAVGVAIGALTYVGVHHYLPVATSSDRMLMGVGAAAVIGLLKEVYDYFHPATHTAEIADFLATAAGGLIGVVVVNTILG
jgi:VanZ family protein